MAIEKKEVENIYREVVGKVNNPYRLPKVEVEYYPYVGLNSRIRRRNGALFVRISDMLADAPEDFHRALAEILIRKLFRKRIPSDISAIYRDYVNLPEVSQRSLDNRKAKGRKIVTTHRGENYDLDEIFDFLNQVYFRGTIPKPVLTWSSRKTYRILGHHDSTHDTIVISKSLDDLMVPKYVVEYVVYHEMLHVKHPTKHINGRRYNHTAAFRRDEGAFAFFHEAEDWIENNTRKLKRAARASRK